MNEELAVAIDHLQQYGYCLLPDRIPRSQALALGERCLALCADPDCVDFIQGDDYYKTLFGMLNLDDRTWSCAFHADSLAVARTGNQQSKSRSLTLYYLYFQICTFIFLYAPSYFLYSSFTCSLHILHISPSFP